MRFFEIVLAILVAVVLFGLWIPAFSSRIKTRPLREIVTVGLLIVILGHVVAEGSRWQMFPFYTLAGLILLACWLIPVRPLRAWWQWTGLILGTLLFFIALLPPLAFPIPPLPAPTGAYSVGTTNMHMIDNSREEIYGDSPGSSREFMVQIWYPADETGYQTAEPAPYLPNAASSARTIATRLDLPAFALDHASLIQSYSRVEPPVSQADDRFPVLIFSHGYNSLRGQSATLMQDLASHGYIVVATEHTYGAAITIFPEGRIEFLDPITLSGEGAAYDANARRLGLQWQHDIEYLLSELELLNQSDTAEHLLAGAMDLEHLGVFGHSTGGGATVRVCQVVDCDVAVGLDAWLGPVDEETLESGTDIPTFFFMSESWPSAKNTAQIFEFMGNSADAQWFTIAQTGHYDFTDIPFLSPLTSGIGLSGEIDSTRGQEIVREYTRAYLDLHIKGIETDLFAEPNGAYPEVRERLP